MVIDSWEFKSVFTVVIESLSDVKLVSISFALLSSKTFLIVERSSFRFIIILRELLSPKSASSFSFDALFSSLAKLFTIAFSSSDKLIYLSCDGLCK